MLLREQSEVTKCLVSAVSSWRTDPCSPKEQLTTLVMERGAGASSLFFTQTRHFLCLCKMFQMPFFPPPFCFKSFPGLLNVQ